MSIRWEKKEWEQLTKDQLYDILHLRSEVFVVEQTCVYQDIDGKDAVATHVLGYKGNELLAYSRVFKNTTPCVIGRVLVQENHRKKSIGKKLMIKSINEIPKQKEIQISAQKHLKKFYVSLGFSQSGEGYLEDGIPHVPMALSPRLSID